MVPDGKTASETEQLTHDASLVAGARRGDETAWLTLVGCHQEAVYRLAYLILGPGPDTAVVAEDIAQETFVRAFRHLDRFAGDRPLRPWLLTIAANLARNRRRSVGRYWAALRRWWQSNLAEQAAAAPVPDEQDDSILLWEAIQRLTPDHRQVLYLRYFLDMSEAEMAELLEKPPGTVKSRLFRAREVLKEILRIEFPILYETWQAE